MSDIILFRTLIPWLRSDWTYKCTQTYRLQKKLVKILHEHDYIVFEKKKGEFDCNQNLIDQGQEGEKSGTRIRKTRAMMSFSTKKIFFSRRKRKICFPRYDASRCSRRRIFRSRNFRRNHLGYVCGNPEKNDN